MNTIAIVSTAAVLFFSSAHGKTVSELLSCTEQVITGACALSCESKLPESWQPKVQCMKGVVNNAMSLLTSCISNKFGNDQCFNVDELRSVLTSQMMAEHRLTRDTTDVRSTMAEMGTCMKDCFQQAACETGCTIKPTDAVIAGVKECVKANLANENIQTQTKTCLHN